MITDMWINLPVRNLEKAKSFFVELGFELNSKYNSKDAVSLSLGEKGIIVMLFPEETFLTFSKNHLPDPREGTEVLFSISVPSPKDVDEIAGKVEKAGGLIFSHPHKKEDWMYGFGFSDPDGHRWNVLHMDLSKFSEHN